MRIAEFLEGDLAPPRNEVARPAGFEPATVGLEIRCSIQLSYGRVLVGEMGLEPTTGSTQSFPSAN